MTSDLLFSVLTGFFDSFILSIVVLITLYRFNRTKYVQFLYLTLELFGLFLWIFLTSVSTLLVYLEIYPELATLLGYGGYFSLLILTIFLILFIDSISRQSVDPLKILIYGILAALAVYIALEPGQGAKNVTFMTQVISAIVWSFRSLLWTYYASKVYVSSPKNLKSKSLTVLIGTVFSGVITSFFLILDVLISGLGIDLGAPMHGFLQAIKPDARTNELLLVIGIILIAVPLIIESKLLYILPSKTSRLAVFNDSGLPLFSHYWISIREGATGDTIFSSVMLGVSGILKETLNKGNIREISLDQSVLLLERPLGYPITFVLETTRTSKSLPKALHLFAERFVEQFEESLSKGIVTQTNYISASGLVAECFPFLPEY
ncbi:MAG: hypothetical protein ACFFD4_09155 [Candidatus Odinarchaeota archaeon]